MGSATVEALARRAAWLSGGGDGQPPPGAEGREADQGPAGAAFTARHFLDDDPRRDESVARRFGPEVLARLRRDRRRLVRRVFGTYPLHRLPREQRVVNLHRLYERRLAHGRALLLPLLALGAFLRRTVRGLRWFARAVGELRRPSPLGRVEEEAEADFATAVRKIDRLRGPVVQACLRLRARVDAEYLGVRLPGAPPGAPEGAHAERDLDFLSAPAPLRRAIEEERDRARADVRRLSRLLVEGLFGRVAARLGTTPATLGPEHVRAAAFAWRADLHGIRSLLAADDVLATVLCAAPGRPLLPGGGLLRFGLRRAFRAYVRARGRALGLEGRARRRAAFRAVLHDVDGVRRALRVWAAPDAARAEEVGERRLAEVLRHPARASEMLVTLRAVSTLALLDVLHDREHVYRLGGYAEDGEDPGEWLRLAGDEDRASSSSWRPA
jgi:hypothetical protein